MTKYKKVLLDAVEVNNPYQVYQELKDSPNESYRDFLEVIPKDCRTFKSLADETDIYFESH